MHRLNMYALLMSCGLVILLTSQNNQALKQVSKTYNSTFDLFAEDEIVMGKRITNQVSSLNPESKELAVHLINTLKSTSDQLNNNHFRNHGDDVRSISQTHTEYQERPVHCIPMPKVSNQCTTTHVKLPNLIGHYTREEIVDYMSLLRNKSINTNCHPNFEMFTCSIVFPVCIDMSIMPCKSLCQSVRRSCESSMIQANLSWPLDCSGLPGPKKNCISKKLPIKSIQPIPRRRKNKFKKNHNLNASTSTTNLQKEILFRNNLTDSFSTNATLTTISPLTTPNVPSTTTYTKSGIIEPSNTMIDSTFESKNLTQSIPVSGLLNLTVTSTNATTLSSNIIHDKIHLQEETMPDLTYLFCKNQPDNILKLRLPFANMTAALNKKKIKIRSFKLLYGTLNVNNTNSVMSSTKQSTVSNITQIQKSKRSTLHLILTNTTNFIMSTKTRLIVKNISDLVLNLNNTEISENFLNSSKTRSYLVAVKDSEVQTIILWPNKSSSLNTTSLASQNIVQAYKNINSKRTLTRVCSIPRDEFMFLNPSAKRRTKRKHLSCHHSSHRKYNMTKKVTSPRLKS